MKKISEHIEYVKGKPHHIRTRFAIGGAVFGSALIALVWFAGSLATGAFAIQGSDFAMSANRGDTIVATTSVSGDAGLAGAAAAVSNPDAPAHIEIVDTVSAVTPKKQAEPTTIPF